MFRREFSPHVSKASVFQRLKAYAGLGALSGSLLSTTAADAPKTFGFAGKEIYPIDSQFSLLRSADIDGDGLNDLIVVNNSRSKINILFNQTGKPPEKRKEVIGAKKEINELPTDARFKIDAIASEKRIASIAVKDLNGDKKPDIAYYGEPKELVVILNDGKNGWSTPKRWPIDDGQLTPNGLTEGDINGDKRNDLILLSESFLYVLKQKEDGTLAEPEKIPFTGNVKALQVLDINGDGRDDLLLVNWDNANPFRFRLQDTEGNLGPETHFEQPPIRSYWSDDLDGDGRTEIVTIAQASGRAQIYNFTQKNAESTLGQLKLGQMEVLPLTRTDKSRRGTLWLDVNKDKRDDLIVAEPNSGQITVYLAQAKGGLGSPQTFPSLAGVTDLAAADWDDDGQKEVFLLSSDERQIGVTRFSAKGRLAFPEVLPIKGRPLAFAAGAILKGDKQQLAVIVDDDGKRSLQFLTPKGAPVTHKLSDSFKSNPAAMHLHDVDQDGLTDLLVLIPYEKVKILRQQADGKFEEIDVAPPGGTMEQPWMATLDADADGKPELLLAQKNFLRAVVLEREENKNGESSKDTLWRLKVKEQINGSAANSRITGAAAVPSGKGKAATLFLLDAERKALTVCERSESGVWQAVKNLSLAVTDFNTLLPMAMNATSANTLSLIGANSIGWLNPAGQVWELTELDSYESPIKDAYLMDVVSGDLNNDKVKDLVFLETGKNYIDIVTYEKPHHLSPANRWQVFEERTFRGRRGGQPEPREAVVIDLTGDGKNDLAIIVHDRIIVYPQE
ncbi:MAG TPA: VCBS repeat-containing protein [Verrucomicrobiae bacterium]